MKRSPFAFAMLTTIGPTSVAHAGNWPDRPIKLIVTYAAGGITDINRG
ncbi:hypothetical protein PO002_42080 [Cupriavidus necator]